MKMSQIENRVIKNETQKYHGETMKLDDADKGSLDALLASHGYSNIQKFASSDASDERERTDGEFGL